MGLICDHFAAPSDGDTAAVIDRVGDPSGASPVAYPTVDSGGFDPVVQMGALEALLTGRSYDDVVAGRGESVLADRDGGERLVVRVAREPDRRARRRP